jgi:hypothetical protein
VAEARELPGYGEEGPEVRRVALVVEIGVEPPRGTPRVAFLEVRDEVVTGPAQRWSRYPGGPGDPGSERRISSWKRASSERAKCSRRRLLPGREYSGSDSHQSVSDTARRRAQSHEAVSSQASGTESRALRWLQEPSSQVASS